MRKIDFKLGQREGVGNGTGVDVFVEYCQIANYFPIASDLARAIMKEFGDNDLDGGAPVRVWLVPARDARFEVRVDGRLIFSKRATYRLPDADEIFYHVGVARKAREERLACAVH